MSRAYINHSNTILKGSSGSVDPTGGITNVLLENGLLGRLSSPAVKSDPGEKKRKKRRAHDPNAPKRALTPYFLFMKSNRARIAEELGSSATAGDVNDEGLKRWHNMPADEKEVRHSSIPSPAPPVLGGRGCPPRRPSNILTRK